MSMTKSCSFVFIIIIMLFQAHLTTIVQHLEGRAQLPLQQPPPTTATDPLPTRAAVDEGKEAREGEGGGRDG